MEEDTKSKLRQLRTRPLCIVCGKSNEADEIAKALGIEGHVNRIQGHEVSGMQGHTFYLGAITLESGEKLKYYLTSSTRQGIQSFAVNLALIFNVLKPRFVLHAGVCAADEGARNRMKLTDVVFGESAINYEEGKFEKVPMFGVVFRPDYNTVTINNAGIMQGFAESTSRPNYHFGMYVSGSAVRADAGGIFAKIRSEVNRNAIALDMEASAFIQLCHHFGSNGPTCLGVIKGISDFGNKHKGTVEGVYEKALWNTADAILEWVGYQIRAITWTPDESGEPGAKIVPGYYDNFVRRVLDNHVQGTEAYLQDDPETKIPFGHVKGLLCVLPKARDASFHKEMGPTQTVINNYKIQEVFMGGKVGKRYLCYKAGYFIDWCRCVNSLSGYEDSVYQVGVFERTLQAESYFKMSPDPDAGPMAMVVEWEDVMDWLEDVIKAEQQGTTPPPFKKRPKMFASATDPVKSPSEPRPSPERPARSVTSPRPQHQPAVGKKLSISHIWSRARGKSSERNGEEAQGRKGDSQDSKSASG